MGVANKVSFSLKEVNIVALAIVPTRIKFLQKCLLKDC